MRRVLGGAAGSATAVVTALVVTTSVAFAYVSGAVGYDVSFPQCNPPASSTAGALPTSTAPTRNPMPPPVPRITTAQPSATASTSRVAVRVIGRNRTAPPAHVARYTATFGIVGVNGGKPFNFNSCVADEYHHTPDPAFYVNTGYDPSYTDNTHTTADCTAKSAFVIATGPQRQAWAVGCSGAEKDMANVTSLGLANFGSWWLDVETANSWCGPAPSNCTDLSLNAYAIQGWIDTFRTAGSTVGIYSNKYLWTTIVGGNTVHGQVADWYATGPGTARTAAAYCSPASSFSGAPVKLAQFTSSVDYDYAC